MRASESVVGPVESILHWSSGPVHLCRLEMLLSTPESWNIKNYEQMTVYSLLLKQCTNVAHNDRINLKMNPKNESKVKVKYFCGLPRDAKFALSLLMLLPPCLLNNVAPRGGGGLCTRCMIWEKEIWIFHTIVVNDPRVCHNLDHRSYLLGQGHSARIPKICVWAITPYCQAGSW